MLCIAKRRAKRRAPGASATVPAAPSAATRAELSRCANATYVAPPQLAEARVVAERSFVAAVEADVAREAWSRSLLSTLTSLWRGGAAVSEPSLGLGEARYYLRGTNDVAAALERRRDDLALLSGAAPVEMRPPTLPTATVVKATAPPSAVCVTAVAIPRASSAAWRAERAVAAAELFRRGLITGTDLADVRRRLRDSW